MIRRTTRFAREASLAAALAATLALAACGGGETPSPEQDGPPDAPTNVRTTAGANYAVVAWDHDGRSVSRFEITRRTSTASGAVIAQQAETFEVGGDQRSFADTGLATGASYAYEVVAAGPDGASAAAPATGGDGDVEIEAGTEMVVGTNDRRWNDSGTIFVVYYAFPAEVAGDPTLIFENRIDGPPGWNDGQPYEWTADETSSARSNGWSFINANSVPPVDGAYTHTLTITGGAEDQVYTHEATFDDADFRLGAAVDIAFSDVDVSGFTVSWTPPMGTVMTVVTLFDQDGEILVREGTDENEFAFQGQSLDDGAYEVQVAPFNFDVVGFPVPVDPLGLSYRQRTVAIGDALSPLCEGSTEAVDVPDDELEWRLRDELGVPERDGPLTCGDLARLEELDLDAAGVASLDGLEVADNLTELELEGNEVSDLMPILGLTGLTVLNLDGNPVPDLGVLDVFVELHFLSIGGTGVTSIGFVSGMTELELLYAPSNDIADLDPLDGTTGLTTLDVGGNAITDLAPIARNLGMERLHAYGNDIDDLSALSGMTMLRELDISDSPLSDADVWPIVEAQDKLEEFQAASTDVTDASTLAGLPNLRIVELQNTAVTDVAFLSSLSQLEVLALDGVQLDDPGQLATASGLVELGLDGAGLANLDFVAGLAQLEWLDVSDNDITDIGPLVDNLGIGEGDTVYADGNPLDPDDPQVAADIQELLDRGVDLQY